MKVVSYLKSNPSSESVLKEKNKVKTKQNSN